MSVLDDDPAHDLAELCDNCGEMFADCTCEEEERYAAVCLECGDAFHRRDSIELCDFCRGFLSDGRDDQTTEGVRP